MYTDTPPFERGQTFFNGGTTDATSGVILEGKEYVFWDATFSQYVRLRLVRNVSGITLEPRRLVIYKVGQEGRQVDGYTRLPTDLPAGVVDPTYAPTAVAANDVFFIVVKGPCLVSPSLAAGAENVFSAGSFVAAVTAATSQATTAGRVGLADFTGATSPLASNVLNHLGRALTARTTANTGGATTGGGIAAGFQTLVQVHDMF